MKAALRYNGDMKIRGQFIGVVVSALLSFIPVNVCWSKSQCPYQNSHSAPVSKSQPRSETCSCDHQSSKPAPCCPSIRCAERLDGLLTSSPVLIKFEIASDYSLSNSNFHLLPPYNLEHKMDSIHGRDHPNPPFLSHLHNHSPPQNLLA